MTTADLPAEIVAEILSRLPVQSLFRFRSTSKSLRSIIDSHNFINLHLKNFLNRSLFLRHNFDIYQIQIDDYDFSNLTKSIMIPLNHPFITKINPYKLNRTIAFIGSSNGLLAIYHGKIAFTNPYGLNEVTFWNPNTRKHRIIPFLPLPITRENCSLCVHGFGFDPVSGDYKLLRISWLVDLDNPFYDSHVTLFSSKTNSWKIIPSMPYTLIYAQINGVFLENSLHWIMTKKLDRLNPCLIVAFNLTLDIFNEVPLPDEISQEVNESFDIDVAVLGGCLCMTVSFETSKIDVWVMKEYGCKDSWCKLFTLVKSCFSLPLKSSRPLGYSSDGSKVLLEGIHVLDEVSHSKLFWYDLKSEQVGYVEGIPDLNGAMICNGSLVPPTLPDNCTKKEKNRTSERKRRYLLSFCYV